MQKKLKVVLVACLFSLPALGRAELNAKIGVLMDLMHVKQAAQEAARKGMEVVLEAGSEDPALKDAAKSLTDSFNSRMDMDRFMAVTSGIYAKHFDESDIDALIAFYGTPTGQKFVKEQPAVMRECMAAGEAWGKDEGKRIMPTLKDEVAEYGRVRKMVLEREKKRGLKDRADKLDQKRQENESKD